MKGRNYSEHSKPELPDAKKFSSPIPGGSNTSVLIVKGSKKMRLHQELPRESASIESSESNSLKLKIPTTSKQITNQHEIVTQVIKLLRSRHEPTDLPGMPMTDTMRWAVLLLKDLTFQGLVAKLLGERLLEIAEPKKSLQSQVEMPLLAKDTFVRILVQICQFTYANININLPECDANLVRHIVPYSFCRAVTISENKSRSELTEIKSKILLDIANMFDIKNDERTLSIVIETILLSFLG